MTRVQLYLVLSFALMNGRNAYSLRNRPFVVSGVQDLMGGKVCAWGPTYWCHNITQAAECHAIKHCVKEIWENPKEKLPQDNDSVCEICKDMVQQARDQLVFYKPQDDFGQMLEESCNLIPLKLVSAECHQLANDFTPELFEALTSRMDSQMVCHISGLCNSPRIDKMLAKINNPKEIGLSETKNDDLGCDTCQQSVEFLHQWLVANNTQKKFQQIIEKLCEQTGKFKEECLNLARHYGNHVYDTLVQKLKSPDKVCRSIGVCHGGIGHVQLNGESSPVWTTTVAIGNDINGNDPLSDSSSNNEENDATPLIRPVPEAQFTGNVEEMAVQSGGKVGCQFCQYALHYLQEYLANKKTEEEIKAGVDRLCLDLGGEFSNQCKLFVDKYGDALITLLAQKINPIKLCAHLRLCSVYYPTTTSEPATAIGQPGEEILPSCIICTIAVKEIIDLVGKNKTKEAIDAAMDRVCTHLPKRLQGKCLSFMKKYGHKVAEMILIHGTAHKVCVAIHLCLLEPTPQFHYGIVIQFQMPLERWAPQTRLVDRVSQMVRTEGDSGKCVMCEFFVATLEHRLQEARPQRRKLK